MKISTKRRTATVLSTFSFLLRTLPAMAVAGVVGLAPTGAVADPLQSGTYSFSVTSSAPPGGSCTGPTDDNCAHILNSVTIGGTTFTDFTFPSGYSVGGFPNGSNVQSRIHNVPGDFVFSSPTYAADMLANVFSDTDLNKYQQVDSGAGSGFSVFSYPNDVPATSDFFFITTERNGNNDQVIQAFDVGGNPLGTVTVDRLSPDYSNTGVEVGLNQDSFISVIQMDQFNVSADPANPSQVRSLRISYTGNDGADHKTFIIGAQVIGAVVANDDDFSAITVDSTAGGTVGSVLTNDDINGGDAPLNGSATTITVTDNDGLTGVTISDDGTITVPPGTSAGTYDIEYQLCDQALPTVCNTAVATVVVGTPTIIAVTDNNGGTPIDGTTGGTTPSVLSNDRLNGSTLTNFALVNLTPGTAPSPAAGSIVMNADGTITIAPGTTPGSYSYPYQICEAAAPTNCATATATVIVSGASILLPAIEEELTRILEDDRAAALALQREQINSYAADARDRLARRAPAACLADVNAAAQEIRFDTDKAIIKPQGERVLDEIATILQSCPGIALEIAGHTDSDASDAYNVDLSQRRVDAVLRALTARDVDTTQFSARGYGESQPVASNDTAAGKALNRRVEFNEIAAGDYACEDSTLVRELDGTANNSGTTLIGRFLSDQHDCAGGLREVYEGSINHLDTDEGLSQSLLNLSYRRERFTDEDSIRGFFVGAYRSQSDVTSTATGDIDGFGINAGVYGADRLNSGLIFDFNLGAAVGRHSFDLAFDDALGTISADGDYTYVAAFAGAAVSGEVLLGSKTVSPRVGIDYVFSPGTDADVNAALGALTESGVVELGSLSGGRLFAELRTEWTLQDGDAILSVTPRIACYEALGGIDGACGFGGSIGLATVDDGNGLAYGIELDAEGGDGFSRASLTGSVSRQLGESSFLRGGAKMGTSQSMALEGAFEMNF